MNHGASSPSSCLNYKPVVQLLSVSLEESAEAGEGAAVCCCLMVLVPASRQSYSYGLRSGCSFVTLKI